MKKPEGYYGWDIIHGERGFVWLKDVLHNLSASENGDNHQFGKGVLVGVIGTLCACGLDFDEATKLAWQAAHNDCHYERIPVGWRDGWHHKITKHTIPKKG